MHTFALGIGYVGLAMLDIERHKLEGLLAWYAARFAEERSAESINQLAQRHPHCLGSLLARQAG
jgi:hypothetical protein